MASYTQSVTANYVDMANSNEMAGYYDKGNYGEYKQDDLTVMTMNYQKAIRILRHIANGATQAFNVGGLGLIVNITVALCKRGQLSSDFINKVESSINQDLGKPVNIRPDAITSYYQNFGGFINGDNIKQIQTRWIALVPQHALRLTLIIQQISGSGLTAFLTIGRALNKYPDFP